jgi:hypothetical protein
MKQSQADRVESISQKIIGIQGYAKRLETCLMLDLKEEAKKAIQGVRRGLQQCEEINEQD